jgi:SAM-dependent methyltransferase
VGRKIKLPTGQIDDGKVDLVVGDLAQMPVVHGRFDVALALNAIDMMPKPEDLVHAQHELLKAGGVAIQSCPYIWHSEVAYELRRKLPKEIKDSAKAVEWLYQQVGFQIEQSVEHLPWLFFKHLRQLEIYSVHLFQARKAG